MSELPVMIRAPRPTDEGYILKSWLRVFRKNSRMRHLPEDVYYQDQADQIRQIISSAETLIAANPDDDDEIHGYATVQRLDGDPLVLHFAYTRGQRRRQGVFRRLAEAHGMNLKRAFYYTHACPMTKNLLKRFPLAVYRRDIVGLAG